MLRQRDLVGFEPVRRRLELRLLLLVGFALIALPLMFALINNAISIHELSTKSQRAVYNAVQATQNSRLLIELLTGMERSARQYSILGEPELFNGFRAARIGLHVERYAVETEVLRNRNIVDITDAELRYHAFAFLQ